MLGRELAAAGLVIVSGLARGIDGEAHRGALDAGGTTVAVARLRDRSRLPRVPRRACGAEFGQPDCDLGVRPGVEPAPWRFPARNRIIAGLCATTAVVEARERSGALITADLRSRRARTCSRSPARSHRRSPGTNDLLRLGAIPLTGADDVLELFGLAPAAPRAVDLCETADSVLARLRDGPASADELARATGLEAGALASALTELEARRRRGRGRRCVRAN